ncbi:hypothetical protein GS506_12855 [Rhodococcus hoagii]|nr:hypothetical protein [Prescottella equi]
MRVGSITGVQTEISMVWLPKLGHCLRIHQGSGRTIHLPADMASTIADRIIDGLELLDRRNAASNNFHR